MHEFIFISYMYRIKQMSYHKVYVSQITAVRYTGNCKHYASTALP